MCLCWTQLPTHSTRENSRRCRRNVPGHSNGMPPLESQQQSWESLPCSARGGGGDTRARLCAQPGRQSPDLTHQCRQCKEPHFTAWDSGSIDSALQGAPPSPSGTKSEPGGTGGTPTPLPAAPGSWRLCRQQPHRHLLRPGEGEKNESQVPLGEVALMLAGREGGLPGVGCSQTV